MKLNLIIKHGNWELDIRYKNVDGLMVISTENGIGTLSLNFSLCLCHCIYFFLWI